MVAAEPLISNRIVLFDNKHYIEDCNFPHGIYIKIFVMTQGTQIWSFLKCNILYIRIKAKNVIFGANNTPNLQLKLFVYVPLKILFLKLHPAKYVKLTEILICLKFQLGTIFFQTITMSKIDFSTLGAILGRRGWGKKLSPAFKWTIPV